MESLSCPLERGFNPKELSPEFSLLMWLPSEWSFAAHCRFFFFLNNTCQFRGMERAEDWGVWRVGLGTNTDLLRGPGRGRFFQPQTSLSV